MPEQSLWKNYRAWLALLLGVLFLLSAQYLLDENYIWHDVAHEVGFALIVAVVIWFVFETATRADTNRAWNNHIDQISKNVFFRVLGRNMSEKFITEVQLVALEKSFERKDFHIIYHLSDDTYIDRHKKVKNFVKMEAMTRFKMKNVGIKTESYPMTVGLPNPIINELKEYCKITEASYKRQGTPPVIIDPVSLNKKLQDALTDDDEYQIPIQCGDPIEIQPNEEVEIKQSFIMAKEEEDTEIVQTLYPTDYFIVTIFDSGADRRILRARAIHREKIDSDTTRSDAGIYMYRMELPLLPFQGFAVFWKKRPTWSPTATTKVAVDEPALQGQGPSAARGGTAA